MATTPASSQRPGISRCNAVPTVTHASAVITLAPSRALGPAASTAMPPAAAAAGITSSRERATDTTPMSASTGVVTAASTTIISAIEGTCSMPNVPTRIDPGSSAAQAGERTRRRRGNEPARGRSTTAPSSSAAGTPEIALCKLTPMMTVRSCRS